MFSKLLQRCAKRYLKGKDPYIIGITGSMWKTTSRMIISQVLETLLPDTSIITSPKNFNSEIGLALSILDIRSFTPTVFGSMRALFQWFSALFSSSTPAVMVLEYGIDGPGDMDELLGICVPHCALFTWLDMVHSEAFESPDEILVEKGKLLLAAKELVLYPWSALYMKDLLNQIEVDVLSYGSVSWEQQDIGFEQYRMIKDSGDRILSNFVLDQGHEEIVSLQSNLVWEISASYTSIGVELAMIVWKRLGLAVAPQEYLEFELQPGRWSLFHGPYDSLIVDSSYNASPKSMAATIKQTITVRNELYPEYELLYCIGDMNELGDFSVQAHETLAGMLSQSAEHIFLTWTQTLHTVSELQKIWYSSSRFEHHDNAIHLWTALSLYLEKHLDKKYMILAKASQWGQFMEESIACLLEPEQRDLLPRQSAVWKKKKSDYFSLH